MNAKFFSCLVFLCVMMTTGAVMGYSGLSFKTWQYWVLTFGYIIVYLCGTIRGGCR